MRIPSRQLHHLAEQHPPHQGGGRALANARPLVTAVGFLLLVILLLSTQPLDFGVPATMVLLGGVTAAHLARKHTQYALQRRLEERRGEGLGQFARSFDRRCTDSCVLQAVYEELQGGVDFPIRADDSLWEVLGMDEEDLEVVTARIALRSWRSLRGDGPTDGQVKTVRDLVSFFQEQPRLAA